MPEVLVAALATKERIHGGSSERPNGAPALRSAGTIPGIDVEAFIAKWAASGAAERANKDAFLLDLCDVLGVPRPDPATGDPEKDRYTFERDALIVEEGEKVSIGKMDLYKEGCFVLEAKQGSEEGSKKIGSARRHTAGWVIAMQTAEGQVRSYARTLPAPPPILVVCDIGYCFDLFATFDGSTAYRPFPDPQHNRISLAGLGQHLELFRAVFTDPLSLDPTRRSAAVTREVAARLAALAKELHAAKHDPEQVARFLMRCLFTMFAEDVGLFSERAPEEDKEKLKRPFTEHLEQQWIPDPERFATDIEALWQAMNVGDYVFGIGKLLKFNGGLFTDPAGLPLTKPQLQLLLEAARCNWSDVEPAIFGTLLEQALGPEERHQLGAHFTPRAYVERLVRPTIEEPVRDEWNAARAEALAILREGNDEKTALKAAKVARDFHHRLCHTRVLDPACGSGNFLYVTLDLFKRIEAEILAFLAQLGDKAYFLDVEGLSVTPQQFLGIEIKPWAKEIAELVLWIGYLQWHFRTHGRTPPRQPVLHDYRNIECRDAVLAYDRIEGVVDAKTGNPITQWDGKTFKPSPVTGENVPDESARIPLHRYVNPRKAEWPEADFVVGNPPFIGKLYLRVALGDGYVEALRLTYAGDVPDGSDYVLYWWHKAARLVAENRVSRAGLITTNSITQTFNRRVVAQALEGHRPVSLAFAIPDHPWVSSDDGAQVRIAMTVIVPGSGNGTLATVVSEQPAEDDTQSLEIHVQEGRILPSLRIGPAVDSASSLRANSRISGTGLIIGNRGFVLNPEEATTLRADGPVSSDLIFPLRNGRDLTESPRGVFVIDTFGWGESELRRKAPGVYQRLVDRVLPERRQNRDERVRKNWWLFRRTNEQIRLALSGLPRYIATPETARRRFFMFLDASIRPEHKLVVIGSSDAFLLGLLSSRAHVTWAIPAGGHLGVGNDPVYSKTRCFETFPAPEATEETVERIRQLGESLDSLRKERLALHPDLTLSGIYGVLEKVRAGEALTAKEKRIHEKGLVSVLKQIHDDLDAAVLDAYGWPRDLSEDEVLERLVALSRERFEEEKNGLIRWLRPEFQAPKGAVPAAQSKLSGTEAEVVEPEPIRTTEAAWPKQLPAQISAIRDLFRVGSRALRFDEVARAFKGARKKDVEAVLDSLTALGLLTRFDAAGVRCWRAAAGQG